jgi:hypothetical protein
LIGILLVVPLLLVTITGLLLNHTVDLGLSKRRVTADWIQSRYGMTLKGEPKAYGLERKTYAGLWDGKLFHRSNIIADSSPLVGAVPLRDGTAVVTASAVHYFGLDGELIETLGPVTLPEPPITRAGRSQDLTLVLETDSGTFTADANLLEFTETPSPEGTEWSAPVVASEAEIAAWKSAFSGDGIPLDRVILDIHSGRFFGSIGKWIYDLLVMGILILSVTGIVLYVRIRRRSRTR